MNIAFFISKCYMDLTLCLLQNIQRNKQITKQHQQNANII